jgi:hypothetical protein
MKISLRQVPPLSQSLRLIHRSLYWRMRHWWVGPPPVSALGPPPPLQPKALVESVYAAHVSAALRQFEYAVFPYLGREDRMLTVEADTEATRTVAELVISPRFDREIFGKSSDAIGFLRDRVRELVVHGITYERIKWQPASEGHRSQTKQPGEYVLPEFSALHPEGVSPVFVNRKLSGYRITPLRAFPWMRQFRAIRDSEEAGRSELPYNVELDEVLSLSMPGQRLRHSPLAAFVDDYWRCQVALTSALAVEHAATYADDHRLRVEAARHRPMKELLRERRLAQMSIEDRAGASLLELSLVYGLAEPVPDYYLAWQHKESRKRAVRLREMLLREFSLQVLHPLLKRNQIAGEAFLKTVGLKGEQQYDDLFDRYVSERLTLEAYWELCRDK